MSDQLREFPELENSTSPTETGSNLREPPEIEAERQRWSALARRVAAGDERAGWEFRTHYAAGIRVMLRRSLGSIGLEALVDETLAGALEEVRRGVIQEPMHFVQFVRSVIERQQQGESMSRKLGRMTPALTTVDMRRLKETTRSVEDALMTFSKREREILVGYYARGLTRYDLECLHGTTNDELDALRMRLQELVRPHRDKKSPVRERREPLVRRAATAS
ncbi:MAG: hypothetical protein ABI972_04285 [Acidobacteriota bacterium]